MNDEKKNEVTVDLGPDDVHITWDEPIEDTKPKKSKGIDASIQVGSHVVYVPDLANPAYTIGDMNPAVGTQYQCPGTVYDENINGWGERWVSVSWGNGKTNQYGECLELYDKQKHGHVENPTGCPPKQEEVKTPSKIGEMLKSLMGQNGPEEQKKDKPDESLKLREKWLEEAFERLTGIGVGPNEAGVSGVSCGYGKGGSRSTKGFSCHKDKTGANQIFIHPDVSEKSEVISTLSTAIASLGLIVNPQLEAVESAMPPYPQHKLADSDEKKDGIRQLKCFCPYCGYTVRTSRKWIDKSGAPYCPVFHTNEELDAKPTFPYIQIGEFGHVRMVVDKDVKEEQSS